MIVYLIENKTNGKQYVGITKGTIENRWKGHRNNANRGGKQTLAKAIRKYGPEKFSIVEIDAAQSIEELFEKEKYWIKILNTLKCGYNETEGSEGSYGRKVLEDTKRKISERQKSHFSKNDARKQHSERMKDYFQKNPFSDEHRKHLSESQKGRKHLEETKRKISDSNTGVSRGKGKPKSQEHKKRIRENNSKAIPRIIKYDTGIEKTYSSLNFLCKSENIPLSTAKWCIKHKKGRLEKYHITIS